MDQIYLNNLNTPIEYIETIAVLCLLLSIEFNYCCHNSNKKSLNQNKIQNYSIDFSYINNKLYSVNNIKNMHKYLMEKIDNLMYWEIFCLKKLDYNLGKYSAFDYINLFFGLGIVFSKKNIDIINIYDSCVNLLEILINQYKICKYNQYIIAMSIIYIKFNNNIYFDKRIFKYIYGVDFSKQKYKSCINEIINIVNDLYNFGYYNISSSIHNENVNNMINIYFSNIKAIKKDITGDVFKNNYNNIIGNKIIENESLIKELFIQYISLLEKRKINNNYINISNNKSLFNSYCDSFLKFLLYNSEI